MTDLVTLAKQTIKSRDYIAKQKDVETFTTNYLNTQKVVALDVQSEDRKLVAHKLELKADKVETSVSATKKAIIFMTGNRHCIVEALPTMESVLIYLAEQAKKSGQNINYVCYAQDYRGRGFNQGSATENWNDYPVLVDTKDQEALIKKIVADGYKPEDLIIIGQSYGSSVGLWALDELGPAYSSIKLFSDRGLGNPFEDGAAKFFRVDQSEAQQTLNAAGMMPKSSFHDIAERLPNVAIISADNDKIIYPVISLSGTFKENEKPGRIWVEKSRNEKAEVHTENLDTFHSLEIPELKILDLLAALLNEQSVKLIFDFKPTAKDGKPVEGFQFKKDATREQTNDYVEFPAIKSPDNTALSSTQDCIFIKSDAIQNLVTRLLDHCNELAEDAQKSNSGGAYKSGFPIGKRYTAMEKVLAVIEIIQGLCAEGGPDIGLFKKLNAMKDDEAPHKVNSGNLYKIYADVSKFITEYERLQQFNTWIAELRKVRQAHQVPAEIPPAVTSAMGLFSTSQNKVDAKVASNDIIAAEASLPRQTI